MKLFKKGSHVKGERAACFCQYCGKSFGELTIEAVIPDNSGEMEKYWLPVEFCEDCGSYSVDVGEPGPVEALAFAAED